MSVVSTHLVCPLLLRRNSVRHITSRTQYSRSAQDRQLCREDELPVFLELCVLRFLPAPHRLFIFRGRIRHTHGGPDQGRRPLRGLGFHGQFGRSQPRSDQARFHRDLTNLSDDRPVQWRGGDLLFLDDSVRGFVARISCVAHLHGNQDVREGERRMYTSVTCTEFP